MQNTSCLNCGAILTPRQKFCSQCGQKTDISRFTLRQLARDFLQTFIKAEKGFWRLMKGLVVNPGATAAAYVEGKRKTYFNPFGFMAICITLMVLLNKWIKPYGDLPVPDPEIMANMPREELKWMYEESVNRIAKAQDITNKNLNVISVLITPYFSFFLWLFFKPRKRNMAEITVAYLLFTAITNLASSIIFSPILASVRNTPAYYFVLGGSIIAQSFYFAWGLKVFFNYRTTGNYIRVLLTIWLIGLIGLILFLALYFIYAYRGIYEVFPYIS